MKKIIGKYILGAACFTIFTLPLASCGSTTSDRALSGAGIGAGVGALGGAATGGSPLTGAVVGGAAGAAAGALTNKGNLNLGEPIWRK